METNWIILALTIICVVALVIFLVIRNCKDKDEVIASLNAEDNLKIEIDRDKDIE